MSDSQNAIDPHGDESLAESNAAPWMGIHVLSEFVFCPRAGVLSFEMGYGDTGEEQDHVPPLDYLPDFELELIEERLQQEWQEVTKLIGFGFAVGLVLIGATLFVHLLVGILLFAGCGGLTTELVRRGRVILELARRRDLALRAKPHLPDADDEHLQAVNWWALLKAGFCPVEYAGPHRDNDWRLLGRPWRVLEMESLRIPVFRKVWGAAELYPQHFVRMAAYCRVIEQAEGGRSPYGIVLFGQGHDGCTVPNIDAHRERLQEALATARRLIEAVRKDEQAVEPPSSLSVCSGCRLGLPREYVRGATEITANGRMLPVKCTKGADKKNYHSPCGDRFNWVPPHELAAKIGVQ